MESEHQKPPKYLNYFRKHPSALDVCFQLLLQGKNGITATEASKELGLAIQTVTNSLRDLEAQSMLRSEKKGRVRRYFFVNPTDFDSIGFMMRIIGSQKIEGRRLPVQFFISQLARRLKECAQKDKKNIQVLEGVDLYTPIVNMKSHIQITSKVRRALTIFVFHIATEESIVSMFGRLVLLIGQSSGSDLTLLLFFNPERRKGVSYLDKQQEILSYVEKIFEVSSIKKHSGDPTDTKRIGLSVNIIAGVANEGTMLLPGQVEYWADKIWQQYSSMK